MNAYPAGSHVNVVVPLLDLNGAVIAPVGGTYRVLDETDARSARRA